MNIPNIDFAHSHITTVTLSNPHNEKFQIHDYSASRNRPSTITSRSFLENIEVKLDTKESHGSMIQTTAVKKNGKAKKKPNRRSGWSCSGRFATLALGVLSYTIILKNILTDFPSISGLLEAIDYDIPGYFSANNETEATEIVRASTGSEEAIRKWGCHRRETPMIFVHIGKAGGGEIRVRLALSAENYTRENWHSPDDNHFYPIWSDADGDKSNTPRRGRFCNSKYPHAKLIPPNNQTRIFNNMSTFEGAHFCNATTPFGTSVACPMSYQVSSGYSNLCQGCDDEYYLNENFYENGASDSQIAAAFAKIIDPPPAGHTCDTVYVSHNGLGNEMSWLPPRYLKEHWWDNSRWKTNNENLVEELESFWESLLNDRKHRMRKILDRLAKNGSERIAAIAKVNKAKDDQNELGEKVGDKSKRWCPAGYVWKAKDGVFYDRPKRLSNDWKRNKSIYLNCTKPIAEKADRAFEKFWLSVDNQYGNVNGEANYSPVYASLPLHRIVMLRDPWTWIVSKLFWHSKEFFPSCHRYLDPAREDMNPNLGWIELYSLEYMFSLCGNECQIRWQNRMITIAGIEAQAKSNLRNSFSVVGLLEESDSFFEMIHKRLEYVDMNKTVSISGRQRHSTGNYQLVKNCKTLFTRNEKFRDIVRSSIPAFAALERVYQVGIEVYRFQRDELSKCD